MTESNIYETPAAELVSKEQVSEEQLDAYRTIAKRQKQLIYAFIIYILASVIFANLGTDLRTILRFLIGIPLFIALIIFNGRLCWILYGAVGRSIMISLGIIPLVNFIVILIVNSKARRVLKKAGFKIGFMGVKVDEISKK